MQRPQIALLALLLCHLLAGCGAVVTYADVQQTAQAGGCWPNRPNYPTPPPVTVTPAVPLLPTPVGTAWPTGVPSPTRLPTTTPYPRCPVAPARPWPPGRRRCRPSRPTRRWRNPALAAAAA